MGYRTSEHDGDIELPQENPRQIVGPYIIAKKKSDFDPRSSVIVKLAVIIVMGLLLLIPAAMIQSLVSERQVRRNDVKNEVSEKWGKDQCIGGPVLSIPYLVEGTDKGTYFVHFMHVLPTTLSYEGSITPEVRHRSIYDVMLYGAKLHITGSFSAVNAEKLGIRGELIRWNDAFLTLGIPDMHGIRDSIVLQWNGTTIPFTPGIDSADVFQSGAKASLACVINEMHIGDSHFALDLNINGSSTFTVLPLGNTTTMSLTSNWDKPSFTGAFLPDTRTVSGQGFTAKWKVLDLNRNIRSIWTGYDQNVERSEFGVELRTPVDNYQESDRATKYASMFIGLTFLTFFLVELLNRMRVHPIQYLLIGLSLVVFYLLLLSFSEQMRFGMAYLIAAGGIVGLVTAYSATIVKRGIVTALLASIFIFLYGYLYVLLQLEDWSLLLGSLGLFLILAIVMFLTRKIDWYDLQRSKHEAPPTIAQ